MRVVLRIYMQMPIIFVALLFSAVGVTGNAAAQSWPTISVRDTVANEGDGVAKFTVRLSGPSSQTVSLRYETFSGSALFGSDYASTGTQPLSFAPGETAKDISVSLGNDTIAEGTESFYLRLRDPINGFVGSGTATASIFDDDVPAGTPVLAVSDPVVDESAGSVVFALSLDRRSTSTVKVNYATQAGTAGSGDFTAKSGTVTFAPGQRVKTVSVPILDDTIVEDIETFSLLLSKPVNATLPDNRGTARIWSSDLPPVGSPTITPDNTVANEGDGIASFLVRLSRPSSQTVSLWYETASGSALFGSDFSPTGTAPLSFAPGETAKIVSVSLGNDTTAEGTESFYLRLRDASNGFIGIGTATATIFDNDVAAGTPVIAISDPVADETAGNASFVISLGQQSTSTVTVKYATRIGSAGSADLTAGSGVVAFAPRDRVKTIFVPILNDATVENTENFNLLLSNPINATLPDNRGTAQIWSSDLPTVALPTITADDASASEGNGIVNFVIRLSSPSKQTVLLQYETASGSALGSDYASTGTQPLSFAPGEMAKVVSVSLVDDVTREGTESFYLRLRDPANGIIGIGTATATIVDNDDA